MKSDGDPAELERIGNPLALAGQVEGGKRKLSVVRAKRSAVRVQTCAVKEATAARGAGGGVGHCS